MFKFLWVIITSNKKEVRNIGSVIFHHPLQSSSYQKSTNTQCGTFYNFSITQILREINYVDSRIWCALKFLWVIITNYKVSQNLFCNLHEIGNWILMRNDWNTQGLNYSIKWFYLLIKFLKLLYQRSSLFIAPFIFLSNLLFLLRSKVILDTKKLTDLLRRLASNHFSHRFASNIE